MRRTTLKTWWGRAGRRRWAGLAGCMVAAAALVVGSSGAGLSVAAGAPPGGGDGGPPVPALVWTDCEGGFECATAQVPLDYRDPAGRTIALAVIRHRVADPARRTGTLLLQPGGPGSSGVDFVRGNIADLPAGLRDRFDVFGFDVRGVARSGQIECWDDARYTQAVTAARGRPGPGAFDRALAEAADFDAACEQKVGDLLPFLGTGYVVRDIDLLRQALGEDDLTFYGRSFGSFIGSVYASMFPDRVRAMVLDGAYDPERHTYRPYESDLAQYLALDGAVRRFLSWCGRTPALCPFGAGAPGGDTTAAFEALIRRLDAEPLPIPDRGVANGYTLAYRMLFNINEGQVFWPAIGQALRQAELRDPTSFLLRPPTPASYDFLAVNVVVECIDRLYPRDLRTLERKVAFNAAAAPLLGPPLAYGPPTYDHQHAPACVQWPGERVSRYHGSFRAAGSAPILVIGTTGDPDTPYQDAVAQTRILDNASLLTFRAEGHGAFGRSACATGAVTAYLADLVVPPSGTVCADEAPPAPPAAPRTRAGAPRSELIDGVQEGFERIGVPR